MIPDTNRQTSDRTIQSPHAWLRITTTPTTAITPSHTPAVRISTHRDDASPRGCTGSLLSGGTANATRTDADVSGVDSPALTQSTCRGRVARSTSGT
jgi:hypothetical protein